MCNFVRSLALRPEDGCPRVAATGLDVMSQRSLSAEEHDQLKAAPLSPTWAGWGLECRPCGTSRGDAVGRAAINARVHLCGARGGVALTTGVLCAQDGLGQGTVQAPVATLPDASPKAPAPAPTHALACAHAHGCTHVIVTRRRLAAGLLLLRRPCAHGEGRATGWKERQVLARARAVRGGCGCGYGLGSGSGL